MLSQRKPWTVLEKWSSETLPKSGTSRISREAHVIIKVRSCVAINSCSLKKLSKYSWPSRRGINADSRCLLSLRSVRSEQRHSAPTHRSARPQSDGGEVSFGRGAPFMLARRIMPSGDVSEKDDSRMRRIVFLSAGVSC